ncbi:MAG: SEC-C motif-containing protein [Candidatus Aldehydirespiratoraceae bacterium]
MASTTKNCPCGGEEHSTCCGPILNGGNAATAEALMRSRFTAFVLRRSDYLLESWASETRPPTLDLDRSLRWLRLEIVDTVDGRMFDTDGVVEFKAHYEGPLGADVLHERSTFRRHNGRWVYVSGVS